MVSAIAPASTTWTLSGLVASASERAIVTRMKKVSHYVFAVSTEPLLNTTERRTSASATVVKLSGRGT